MYSSHGARLRKVDLGSFGNCPGVLKSLQIVYVNFYVFLKDLFC